MSFTNRQKAAAKATVTVFETGKSRGNYSAVAVLADGAGISYGTHQATHASGTLYKIVKLYTEISSDPEAQALKKYLPLLSKKGKSTAESIRAGKDATLKSLLKTAGTKPDMRYAQDYVFSKNYLEPAVKICEESGFKSALSLLVIFDSLVHGNFARIRDRVPGSLGEKAWIKRYCEERRNWLMGHSNKLLRTTAIRPKTYLGLIEAGNWELNTPYYVHGVKLTEEDVKFHESTLIQSSKQPADVPAEVDTESDVATEPVEDNVTEEPAVTPAEPVDDYPETPKPGEPVSEEPAEPGEPIAGARPTDPPVIVPKVEPPPTDGPKTWVTTVRTWWASLGLGGGAVMTAFSGATNNPALINFLLLFAKFAIAFGALAIIVYLIIRAVDKSRREKQAHELQKLEMQLRADPTKYNVKVDRREVVREEVPNAKAEESENWRSYFFKE